MRIDIYHHFEAGSMDRKLDDILMRLEAIMSRADEQNALLQQVKDSLANLSNDVDELLARAQGGVSEADSVAFIADLTAVRDGIQAAAGKYVASGEAPPE